MSFRRHATLESSKHQETITERYLGRRLEHKADRVAAVLRLHCDDVVLARALRARIPSTTDHILFVKVSGATDMRGGSTAETG